MATQSEQRYSILAVDDNRNALEIIRRILGHSGYEVITCEGFQMPSTYWMNTELIW
jgi:CheY-like chemotaxis protein